LRGSGKYLRGPGKYLKNVGKSGEIVRGKNYIRAITGEGKLS
jgi:hypothetical protein